MKNFLITVTLFFISNGFAFFCPTNFKQINLGQTMEQVVASCGKPTQQTSKEEEPESPQEWSYYIPQAVSNNGLDPMQGTLKTEFAFDANGKVININVNGIAVGASSICGNNIQLGDSRDAVKNACGKPYKVDKVNQGNSNAANDNKNNKKKITTFIYNTTPPVKLIFENGVLTSRE